MRFVDHYRFLKDLCTGKQDEALRGPLDDNERIIYRVNMNNGHGGSCKSHRASLMSDFLDVMMETGDPITIAVINEGERYCREIRKLESELLHKDPQQIGVLKDRLIGLSRHLRVTARKDVPRAAALLEEMGFGERPTNTEHEKAETEDPKRCPRVSSDATISAEVENRSLTGTVDQHSHKALV